MFFHGIFLPWMRRIGKIMFLPALIVVAWGELTPHPPRLAGPWLWDKLDHFTAYFGLSLLATLGWGLRRSLAWVFLGVVALGGALEIIQTLVGRDGSGATSSPMTWAPCWERLWPRPIWPFPDGLLPSRRAISLEDQTRA